MIIFEVYKFASTVALGTFSNFNWCFSKSARILYNDAKVKNAIDRLDFQSKAKIEYK